MLDAIIPVAGFEIAIPAVILGMIIGMTYGILAVGLVLVFRSNKIINFAHGEIGAFGAVIFGVAVTRWHVPYWVGFPLALGLSAGLSSLAEVAVVRRLRNAPRLMSIVATLGVAQFLLALSIVINSQAAVGQLFPQPSWLPDFFVGPLLVTRAHVAMLLLTPVLVFGLVTFLRRSKYGLAIRGAAANPDAAHMAGISTGRMSAIAWGIAGAVSAYTAILFLPTRGVMAGESFGPGLLLRALVAAVIGRMSSLPMALVAGVGVGVIEQLLLWNAPRGGLVEGLMFLGILGALLAQRRAASGREEQKGTWASVQAWAPLPEGLLASWPVRNLGRMFAGVALVVALALPMVVTHSSAVTLTTIVAFAIIGLSVGVVTGLGGQLTLGQFAVAGIGAAGSYAVARQGTALWDVGGYLAAGAVGAAASIVIGIPALRIRGLMLAVATLGLALVTQSWLLDQSWMLGDGVSPGRPEFGGLVLDSGKSYYVFSVVVLAIALWLAHNVRAGGIGRRLVAVRDNEDNARAFTISATAVKLQGFALAGFLAGIGGAVYGHALSSISKAAFPVANSVDVVVMSVIGGIGVLSGPIVGALFVLGVPAFVPLDSAGLAATDLGALALILYVPGGIAQLVRPLRDRLVDRLARGSGLDAQAIRAEAADEPQDVAAKPSVDLSLPVVRSTTNSDVAEGDVLLRATDLRMSFGGVHAVAGVSLEVRRGEIVGLIGPNGAGKTTTFEVLGGFTAPDSGRVVFAGQDITHLAAHQRARLGLIRSFQDAGLFATLTVLDVVRLAQERAEPTRIGPALFGMDAGEGRKDARARELVAAMGLDRYRNKQTRELSTGTRRITELACLVALAPELLLLDEPSSGIAQRETEALEGLLRSLHVDLGITMVVIEHDIPLIMGLSDRIIAMDTGTVIADGPPDEVRNHPRVVSSYLGGDLTAIERSGVVT